MKGEGKRKLRNLKGLSPLPGAGEREGI